MGRTLRKRRHRRTLKFANLNRNSDESLMNLKSWLLTTENCLSLRHLTPEHFPLTGRGLKTLKDIGNNEVLIQLPLRTLITTDTLLQSNIEILLSSSTTEKFSSQSILAAFLAYETHLGTDSKWYLYLETLPQSFTNPDFCSNKEKRALPDFILDALHKTHKIENEFSLLTKVMKRLNVVQGCYCPHCGAPLQEIITFARYKWAYCVVNTRAVYIDDKLCKNLSNIKQPNNLALAPFLDLFNHDVNTAVRVSVVTDDNQNAFYQIVTLKSFEREAQVFINYGAHNSLKLYVEYGFFISCNPLDEIHFDISDVQRCIDVPKNKLDFIMENGLHKNISFTRDGPNYHATLSLFILSTKLKEACWKTKMYGETFSSSDLRIINKLGIIILNLKKTEYTNILSSMNKMKCKSPSFSIATDLVQEYIDILDTAFSCMEKAFCLEN